MNIRICIATLIMICATVPLYGGAHKAGGDLMCFYDSYPGHNKWNYYYCGQQSRGCAGKNGKGKHDKHYTIYDGESFTFTTGNRDTYWCCGGTQSNNGRFVLGNSFYIEERTERQDLGNGGSCNVIIRKTICGTEETIDCSEPDTCSASLMMRNKECVKPCDPDYAFASPTSNTCVPCETTAYQGIRKLEATTVKREDFSRMKDYMNASRAAKKEQQTDGEICVKCDTATEFFNRETKECIKKSALTQHHKDTLKECWRCPYEVRAECVKGITTAIKNGKTGDARFDSLGTDIVNKCHLKD